MNGIYSILCRSLLVTGCLALSVPAWSASNETHEKTTAPTEKNSKPASSDKAATSDKADKEDSEKPGAALPGVTLPAVDTRPAPTRSGHVPQPPTKTRETVTLEPGVNVVVPIAKGHLNRIVTPFEHPSVNTVSNAKIETEGRVLYVATGETNPVTMYVRPQGREDMALSLTLNPIAIPPREITLKLKGEKENSYLFNAQRAGEWERSSDYTATLKRVMRRLALGEIPDGYGFSDWEKEDPTPHCSQRDLSVSPAQTLSGANLIVVISKATNTSKTRLEINEASCAHEGILATAAWPKVSLLPGESTELYIITRRPDEAAEAKKRPSIL